MPRLHITIMPMLAISIWQGTKSIDKDLVDMSKIFHASPWSKVVDVILPQLISHILAAIRYGLGLAWKVVVVVEMFGLSNGVGYQVVRGFNVFSMKAVLAWAISFLVVMIVIEFGIIGWLPTSGDPLAAPGRGLEALDGLRAGRWRCEIFRQGGRRRHACPRQGLL